MRRKPKPNAKGISRRRFLKTAAGAALLAALLGHPPIKPPKITFVNMQPQIRQNYDFAYGKLFEVDRRAAERLSGKEFEVVFVPDLARTARELNPKLAAALKDQEAYAFTDYSSGVIRVFFDTEIFKNKARAFDALTHEFYNAAEIEQRTRKHGERPGMKTRARYEIETFTHANRQTMKLIAAERKKLLAKPNDRETAGFIQDLQTLMRFNNIAIESWEKASK